MLVPDELVGAVMSDLSARRGRVLGSEPVGDERDPGARRRCPQLELIRYADRPARRPPTAPASFTRTFARYEPMAT